MADKLTQQITDALTRAAAQPAGLPLYAGKAEPGLFFSSVAGKAAAQKCLVDGFIRVVASDSKGKTPRDLYGLTEPGWGFLLAQVNPKQVLEDFVRVLETRSGEVGELLDHARDMAAHLQGLKEAVARVLPAVMVARIPQPEPEPVLTHQPERIVMNRANGSLRTATHNDTAVAALLEDSPPDLASETLDRLRDWSGAAGEDCPLPKLYHLLAGRDPQPTIGAFHDCVRQLHAAGAIYLHPWTGPLYALPEPAFALLAGHNIAYYASLR